MAFNELIGAPRGAMARMIDDLRRRIAAARQRRAVFQKTWAELHALSDRDLADLGIARSEIGGLARDAARKM